MKSNPYKIATYKTVNTSEGNSYIFFCDASGARVFTTEPVTSVAPEEELQLAWLQAKGEFNRCEKCGRFVCDTMYNADTFMCVDCSPWKNVPKVEKIRLTSMEQYGFGPLAMEKLKVCKNCGRSSLSSLLFCTECGSPLPKKNIFEEYKERHKFCRKCEAVFTDEVTYCPQCGEKLQC